MTLNSVLGKVSGNTLALVKNYHTGYEYIMDDVNMIISKKLDYDRELRNSTVYGIDTIIYTYDNISCPLLVISVLVD